MVPGGGGRQRRMGRGCDLVEVLEVAYYLSKHVEVNYRSPISCAINRASCKGAARATNR